MIRKRTDYLVVHCSATSPNLDIGAAEIRGWHLNKGWKDIGYHYVIRRNGAVETGRPENLIGSHVQGHNSNSLGICMVGGTDAKQRPQDNYTPEQWASLQTLLAKLLTRYPGARILGHRDFPGVHKACPCFDAIKWVQGLGLPAAKRMQPVAASMFKSKATPETEDGDEADPDEIEGAPEEAEAKTGPGKWLTAILGSGGVGSLAGFGYGMDWTSLLVLMVGLAVITVGVFIAIGHKRRERLWDSLFGKAS